MFWKRNKKANLEENIDEEQLNTLNEETKSEAKEYLKDNEKLGKLIKDADAKSTDKDIKKGFVVETWDNLKSMVDLVRAYINGDFTNIPYKSLVMIVGAIIYFVMPLDAIPDFIAGLGFTDDATVLALTVRQVNSDLKKFLTWKKEQEEKDKLIE